MHEETALLRSRNRKLEDTLTSSGLVAGGKDSVIMRRGRPATKRMKQLVKRIAKAEAALECTRVLMGPEMDDNIDMLVRVASGKDPKIRQHLV